MAIQSAAGASLLVSVSHPATFDAAGYGALVAGATVVGEVSNIGEFGKEFALVTANALAHRGTRKLKGSYNNGTLSPSLNLDTDDAGQGLMETLLESDEPGTFFVVLQNGATYGLEGLVMSFKTSVGEIDSIVTASTSIEITHNDIVLLEPATTP